ncbi:Retrovirus-related Pol polyprotein from type-2 retrotransposable element R2DM [Anthophora plagiata]
MNENFEIGGPTGSSDLTLTTEDAISEALSPTLPYHCRMSGCDRSFTTSRGRGVHEQRAHKNWHDEQQVQSIVHRKTPWSEEEAALLARQEARLTIEGERFLNQALLPYFPNRTLEATKGQRKYQKHKEKVIQIVREIRQDAESIQHRTTTQTEQPEAEDGESLVDEIIKIHAELGPLETTEFKADHLDQICKNIKKWPVKRIFEELKIYLLSVFPPPPNEKVQNKNANSQNRKRKLTKRQERRAEYARMQRAWSKNPCDCLRTMLKDKKSASTPEKGIMLPYWQNVMSSSCDATPGAVEQREVNYALWRPVRPNEIEKAFPEVSTSPGPEGLTARQVRAMPLNILARIFNLFMVCGKTPEHLMESQTVLIPKKDEASEPGEFRPITVSSILTRTFHKVLARRLMHFIRLDRRQKAFVPVDGCAVNTFQLDLILKYHRQCFKPFYLASLDIAKAFDTVTHRTIHDTLKTYGLPTGMIKYVMYTYEHSATKLKCDDWESEPIHPTCRVKQGDPLSPIVFNLIMDRLIRMIPNEIGVDIGRDHFNTLVFADDMMFISATPKGLQMLLDLATGYLAQCGLAINSQKSFTVAMRNVPHKKKSVIDGKTTFSCQGGSLPAMRREDEWKYLGVPFTPEGRTTVSPEKELQLNIEKLTKAPLKPQQRLFALRVIVLPALYHMLTLGSTNLSRLKKIDTLVRGAIRKRLALPHDVTNAFIHANAKHGGFSIPTMRWLMPLRRRERLEKMRKEDEEPSLYLSLEIDRTKRRLKEGQEDLNNTEKLDMRWAKLLHNSSDGKALKESHKVPQQHQWVTALNRLLTGRDFINITKLRINVLPTKSRTSRGRRSDRLCRAGCNEMETLNHILQRCPRTHAARVQRHNAIVSYVQRALEQASERTDVEPHFNTESGLRKPDLVAKIKDTAFAIDAQVVSKQTDLSQAHQKKVDYYQELKSLVKETYQVDKVQFTSVTLSCRGIWSNTSAANLTDWKILKKKELKILSTRALVEGLAAFWRFNRATTRGRMGVG